VLEGYWRAVVLSKPDSSVINRVVFVFRFVAILETRTFRRRKGCLEQLNMVCVQKREDQR
jgi:hypothetical protein